jgi:hypothetical protein
MSSLLEIDPRSFSDSFSERSFKVQHSLVDHPLLSIESIARLSDQLPAESVWRRAGDRAVGVASAGVDPDVGPPSETIRGIEKNGRWVMLRFIEQVPEYAALVNSCLDDVEPYLAGREGGMAQRNGYLFLSSPEAVTPVHFDSEHNLLLQIRGSKEVSISEFANERARRMAVDRHWDRLQPDFTEMAAKAKHYQLAPGEGVYMAPFLPHWVENGEEVSISLSIPFYTEVALRAEHVNKVNARLRRMHLHPRPDGQSETIDKAKAELYKTGQKVRELVRRSGR